MGISQLAEDKFRRKLDQAGIDEEGNPLNQSADSHEDEYESLLDQRPHQESDDDEQEPRNDELEQLRSELNALKGRVGPSQRDAEEFKRLWQEEQARRNHEKTQLETELESMREQLDKKNSKVVLEELFTEEELQDVDPQMLKMMQRMADEVVKRKVPKIDARSEAMSVIREYEANKVVEHRKRVLTDPSRGLHKLQEYQHDPEFLEWMNGDESNVESVTNSLLSATSTDEVDRYAKRLAKELAKFKERKKPRSTDPKASLGSHMRRNPKARVSEEEMMKKADEAKRLARSKRPEDRKRFAELMAELQ